MTDSFDKGISRSGARYAVSRPLLVSALRRFWPGAALMFLVFIILAVVLYADVSSLRYYDYYSDKIEPEYITTQMFIFTGIFTMLASLITAMLCFNFLMNHREAVMLHSLPIRRESHLISAAVSGFILLGAPIIMGGFLFFIVYGSAGYFFPIQALHWTAANLSIAVLSFGIAAFFAMLTGNSIAHGILTLIFINLPLMVESIVLYYCDRFLFGYVERMPITLHFNPIFHVTNYLNLVTTGYLYGLAQYVISLLLFILIGALFLFFAALLYRRRKVESAGDIIAIRQIRPFLRYGAALAFSFLFGFISVNAFERSRDVIAWEIGFSVFGGAFGFFAAEMFIRRTINVFKRYYKGAVGFALVFVCVYLALYNDIPGYGSVKLDAEKLDYIVINSISGRVRMAALGETAIFSGTLSDLDIDDPDGYFADRRSGTRFLPKGSIPPYIADQILKQDLSVLRGENLMTAVAVQNLIAENAKMLSEYTQNSMYNNSSYNYRSYRIPFIARYKDGRVVERNYYFRLDTSDLNIQNNTIESTFAKYYSDVQSINQAAERKRLSNCAARAEYIQLEINGTENKSTSVTLNRGEWDGLFEAYEIDGMRQNSEGTFNDDAEIWREYNFTNVYVKISMPDRYTESINIRQEDYAAADWLMRNGYIDAEYFGG